MRESQHRLEVDGLDWLDRLHSIRDKLASNPADSDPEIEKQLVQMASACVTLALEETPHVDQTRRAVDSVTKMAADLISDTESYQQGE